MAQTIRKKQNKGRIKVKAVLDLLHT